MTPPPSPKPAQHTPGPWQNDPLQPTIWTADGQTKIATINDLPWVTGKSNWMTEQANARLIATAPELLEACRAMLTWCQARNIKPDPDDAWGLSAFDRSQTAIARAEGREIEI